MGLAISVGILADLLENDPESVDHLRLDFAAINTALRSRKLPAHNEPESLPDLDDRTPIASFPYSSLHYLRRAYAHHVKSPGDGVLEFADDADPTEDPILEEIGSPDHHLLWHSDAEGFYVPIDFPKVIEDTELPGQGLGSSHRLFAELIFVAPALGIHLDGDSLSSEEAERLTSIIDDDAALNIEIMVWIALFEAARLSLTHKTAIYFG